MYYYHSCTCTCRLSYHYYYIIIFTIIIIIIIIIVLHTSWYVFGQGHPSCAKSGSLGRPVASINNSSCNNCSQNNDGFIVFFSYTVRVYSGSRFK